MQKEFIEEKLDIARILYKIPGEEVSVRREIEFLRLRGSFEIPGFRKGKAPMHLLRKAVDEVELIKRLIEFFTQQILADLEKNVEDFVSFSFKQVDDLPDGGFSFPVLVFKKPTCTIPDFQDIRIIKLKPTPEMVIKWREQSLQRVQKEYATLEPKDTAAEFGDKVEYHYWVVDKDGKEIFRGEKESSLLDEAYKSPILQQLVGKKRGEVFSFDRVFPKENGTSDVAISFFYHVEVLEVYKLIPQEMNDAFAHEVDERLNTLEELRKKIEIENNEYFDTMTSKRLDEQIIEQLILKSVVGLSEETIQHYSLLHIDRLKSDKLYDSERKKYSTDEEFDKEEKALIEGSLKALRIIENLTEKLNIRITEERAVEFIKNNLQYYENNLQKTLAKYKNDPDFKRDLEHEIAKEEIVKIIRQQATIQEKEFFDDLEQPSDDSENIENAIDGEIENRTVSDPVEKE